MADLTTVTDFDIRFDTGLEPGVNPYSARQLRGTLSPISLAKGEDKLVRTINGTLIDISAPQMRKYQLEISGNDQAPPALDGLWVGMRVFVNSHVEIAVRTGAAFSRPAAGTPRVEGDYTYYRPQFQMLVVEWSIDREEYAQDVGWSLTLAEV